MFKLAISEVLRKVYELFQSRYAIRKVDTTVFSAVKEV